MGASDDCAVLGALISSHIFRHIIFGSETLVTLNTYLTFNGNCREVFDFYRSVFGGEFSWISTFRDAPPDIGVAEADMDGIMHVSFPIGSGVLMGSDMPPQFGPPPVVGSNFSLTISPESREEADRIFKELSDGGSVSFPMQDMFWGAYFGSLTDKFGINWQVDCEQQQG